MRSPSLVLLDSIFRPIFLPKLPERKPRTEWGCQPVAFTRCFKVAPPDRFSSSSTRAVLLPWRTLSAFAVVAWRAALTAFLAGVVFLADFALTSATRGFGAATLAFFGASAFPPPTAVAWAGSRFSVVAIVMMHAPLAVITAVTTWITPKRSHCKRSLWKFEKAMEWRCELENGDAVDTAR